MVTNTQEALPKLSFGEWRVAGGCVWWQATLGPASLVFTTRVGGVSASPYHALNLGLHVGDAPEAVLRNRRSVWAAAGRVEAAPVIAEQVHGAAVAQVGPADAGRGWHARETTILGTDALVTRAPHVP